MPFLEPFRALRYNPAEVTPNDVVAPPYDVINDAQRDALVERSPYNAIVVEVPKCDSSENRYGKAAEHLTNWEAAGILIRDEKPHLYAYKMTYRGLDGSTRSTTGVLGALRVHPNDKGDILPHEQTIPKAKSDRLDLLRATQVNVSPIWGLSLAEGLTALCEAEGEPVFEAQAEDVLHQLWILPDERASQIHELVATAPVVIADGHHRWETALNYSAERRTTDGAGPWDLAFAFVVELVGDELEIGPIHRLLHGEFSTEQLLEHLGDFYEIEKASEILSAPEAVVEVKKRALPALMTTEGMWWLDAKPETHAAASEDLDSARLGTALVGFEKATVSYANNAAEVSDALSEYRAQAVVVIGAASIATIADVAHSKRRMPPKTTFFRPKPRTGMVFRPLAD